VHEEDFLELKTPRIVLATREYSSVKLANKDCFILVKGKTFKQTTRLSNIIKKEYFSLNIFSGESRLPVNFFPQTISPTKEKEGRASLYSF